MFQKQVFSIGPQTYPDPICGTQFSGKIFFCDAIHGTDGNDGSAAHPFASLAQAFLACTAGMNDVVILISDGTTASTQRLSANFNWNKAATHLIGVCSGNGISNRARIAPTTGITAFANFFTVSVDGCYFENLEFFHGFTAGVAASICMTVTGGRNHFVNCHLAGMADTDGASGTSTGSRHLKISTSGENLFEDCIIGDDTIARTVANANVEFASGTPRNVFRDCLFPMFATNAGVLGILGTGNACCDRFQLFDKCMFVNSIKSGAGTTITALLSFTTGAPGGLVIFKDCMSVGATKWGDVNGLANSFLDMAAVSGAAGGLAVNPA